MSQENQAKPRSNSGNQNRRGGNRNRNNNRNRNRNSSQQNGQASGQQRQGRQSGGGPRKRQARPVPLTFWEKILKMVGLYKAPTRPPRRQSAAQKTSQQKAPKTKTRDARSKNAQDTIKAKGRGAGSSGKDFPVETPRLYLGNLSYDAAEKDLEELFKGVGTVRSVDIIYNRHTHRSKGYGFIEMFSVEEAKRAVTELHDKPFMGRNLIVNGAKAKNTDDRPSREAKSESTRSESAKPRPAKSRNNQSTSPAKLELNNISADADQSSLEEHFKGIGNVRRVELSYDSDTHKLKSSGTIEMQKAEDAQRAIEVLHDQPFMGTKLQVTAPTAASQPEKQPAKEVVTDSTTSEEPVSA